MENNKLNLKTSSIGFLSSFLLCNLATILVAVFILLVGKFSDLNNLEVFLNSAVGYLILSLTMYATMFAVFLFFNKGKENKIVGKVSPVKILVYVAIAVATYFILFPIVNCFDSLMVKLGIGLNTLSYELNTTNYFISLISIVILPAVCEELLFRGLIFKGIKKNGKWFSILITSLLFSIYHMSITQTIYPILFGALLTLVMYKENNIIYCISMHLINNFLALTISYFNVNLTFNSWLYILMAIILLIAFISILIVLIAKTTEHEKEKATKDNNLILIAVIIISLILWIITNLNR